MNPEGSCGNKPTQEILSSWKNFENFAKISTKRNRFWKICKKFALENLLIDQKIVSSAFESIFFVFFRLKTFYLIDFGRIFKLKSQKKSNAKSCQPFCDELKQCRLTRR